MSREPSRTGLSLYSPTEQIWYGQMFSIKYTPWLLFSTLSFLLRHIPRRPLPLVTLNSRGSFHTPRNMLNWNPLYQVMSRRVGETTVPRTLCTSINLVCDPLFHLFVPVSVGLCCPVLRDLWGMGWSGVTLLPWVQTRVVTLGHQVRYLPNYF